MKKKKGRIQDQNFKNKNFEFELILHIPHKHKRGLLLRWTHNVYFSRTTTSNEAKSVMCMDAHLIN